MDINRELDRIIVAIESRRHGALVTRLLRWRKAWLEKSIP